ncbi:hypothetical protein AXK60_00330 [Tsukamurella pseudospumae]|uniref:Uncharacterized protein n=1 Tax=Tsukamurella pseudospumae TaxID=239498 RepID=A0A138AVH5_9ACTN|nr:hypothetical protein AXK60_00330 [Tsukamurella pseudospumae]
MVLVVALIIVLAVQPWKKSGGGVQTFELDRAITVEVRTPSGWTAKEMSAEGASAVLILPAGDDRGYDEINTDFKSLRNGRSGKPIHAVVINAGSCSSDAASSWDIGDVDKGTVGEATRLGRRAVWNVRGSDCARMISTDMDSGRPASTASELLVSLAGSGAVVPRHDGTRPSIRPSS